MLINHVNRQWIFFCPKNLTMAIISCKQPNKIFLLLQKSMIVVVNHVETEPPVSTQLTYSHVNVYLDLEATGVKQVG